MPSPIINLPSIYKAKKKTIEFLKLNSRKTYSVDRVLKKLQEIRLFINYNLFRILAFSKTDKTIIFFVNKIILFKAVSRLIRRIISVRFKLDKLSYVFNMSCKVDQSNFFLNALSNYNNKTFKTPLPLINKDFDKNKLFIGFNHKKKESTLAYNRLPIIKYFYPLMKAIDIFDILIVIAETGAGKTTQIPKFLYLAGYTVLGKVGITQPRRVAAINVATRVSFELNKILGDEIGYVIRFEDMTNENTLVKFMTDGILLKELVGSPLLQKYAIIILDEAHERTIFTDVLFTLLRELIYYRKSLKLLICSATINSVKFSKFFNNAPLFQIPGRSFKIQVYHTRDTQFDYLDSVVLTIFQISLKYTYGDILVFLTGQEDIEIIEEIVKRRLKLLKYFRLKFEILPFYSNLSFDAQKRVFSQKREGFRRIILATNIAETSVTIVGVTYVVDSGLCKLKIYNPITRYESLIITPISKSSAWQRSGRAGRVSSGKTYRLYTLSTYKNILNKTTLPEISRANIDNLILILKSLGIHDLINFDLLDKPKAENVYFSLEILYILGALNDVGELTKLGKCMSEFPMSVRLSKSIINSASFNCCEEIAIICSVASSEGKLFYFPKDCYNDAVGKHKKFIVNPKSDHLSYYNVFKSWSNTSFSFQWAICNFIDIKILIKSRFILEQILMLMDKFHLRKLKSKENLKYENILKCVLSGSFMNVACMSSFNTCKVINTRLNVTIHPTSCLINYKCKWVVYDEILYTTKEFIHTLSEIKIEWLAKLVPVYYTVIK